MRSKRLLSLLLSLIMILSVCPVGLLGQLAALAAQQDAYATVISASDFQGGAEAYTNFTAMLNNMKADGYSIPDAFLFGGDYGDSSGVDTNASFNSLLASVQGAFPTASLDNAIMVQGNHDGTGTELAQKGLHSFNDFHVFSFNEDDFRTGQAGRSGYELEVQALANEFRNALTPLIQAGDRRPVFVITHIPLHHSSRSSYGDNIYSKYFVDALNEMGEQLDIIFMFGHNHSRNYDDYIGGSVNFLAKGEAMRVPIPNVASQGADGYTEETLNFTYLNCGYVGYSGNGTTGGSTNVLTAGMFEICPTQIVLTRYSKTGVYCTNTITRINPQTTEPYVSFDAPASVVQGNSLMVYSKVGNIENPTYSWTSNKTNIISITQNGKDALLQFKSKGKANITLTVSGDNGVTKSHTVEINVTQGSTPNPVVYLLQGLNDLNGQTLNLYETEPGYSFNVTGYYEGFGNKGASVTTAWTSTNQDVATVNNGAITITGSGTTSITYSATDGSHTASKTFSVFVTSGQRQYHTFKLATTLTPGKIYAIASGTSAGSVSVMNNRPQGSSNQYLGYENGSVIIKNDGTYLEVENDNTFFTARQGTHGVNLVTKDGKYLRLSSSIALKSNESDNKCAFIVDEYNRLKSPNQTVYYPSSGTAPANGSVLHYSSSGYFRIDYYEQNSEPRSAIYEYIGIELSVDILNSNKKTISSTTSELFDITNGQTLALGAKYSNFGEGLTKLWESSDVNVATVSDGVITFNGVSGTTIITLTVSDNAGNTKSASVTYHVSTESRPAESFTLAASITPGKKYVFASAKTVGEAMVMLPVAVAGASGHANRLTATGNTNISNIGGRITLLTTAFDAIWTAEDSSNSTAGFHFKGSNNLYLRCASTGPTLKGGISDDGMNFTFDDGRVLSDRGFYLNYLANDNFDDTSSSSSANVYLFEECTLDPAVDIAKAGVSVSGKTEKIYSIAQGQTVTLEGIKYNFAESTSETWISDNNDIATVENGVVTFTGVAGLVSITYRATDGENNSAEASTVFDVTPDSKPVKTFKLTNTIEAGKQYVILNTRLPGGGGILLPNALTSSTGYANRMASEPITVARNGNDIIALVENESAILNAEAATLNGNSGIALRASNGKFLRAASTGLTFISNITDNGTFYTVSNGTPKSDRDFSVFFDAAANNFRVCDSTEIPNTYIYELTQSVPFVSLTRRNIDVAGTELNIWTVTSTARDSLSLDFGNFGSGAVVQWHSSNTNIATVSDGNVFFSGENGSTIITVTVSDNNGTSISKSVTYNVSQDPEPATIFKQASTITAGKLYVISKKPGLGANQIMKNAPTGVNYLQDHTVVTQIDSSKNELYFELTDERNDCIYEAIESDLSGYFYLRNIDTNQYLYLDYDDSGTAYPGNLHNSYLGFSDDIGGTVSAGAFYWTLNSSGLLINNVIENGKFGIYASSSGYFRGTRYKLNSTSGSYEYDGATNTYLFENSDVLPDVFIISDFMEVHGKTTLRTEVCKYQTEDLDPFVYGFVKKNNISYSWSADNATVATIDQNGVLTYTGESGLLTVTCTATASEPLADGSYETATNTAVFDIRGAYNSTVISGNSTYFKASEIIPGKIYAFANTLASSPVSGAVMNNSVYVGSTGSRLGQVKEVPFNVENGISVFTCDDLNICYEAEATDSPGYYRFKNIQSGKYLILNYATSDTKVDDISAFPDEASKIAVDFNNNRVYSLAKTTRYLEYNTGYGTAHFRLTSNLNSTYVYQQAGAASADFPVEIRVDAYGGNKDITNKLQSRYNITMGSTERLLSFYTGLSNPQISWSSANTNIVTINNEGLITYTGQEGVVTIYLDISGIDASGNSCSKRVQTTLAVSVGDVSTPTEQYPDYPSDGSVRINKTANPIAGGTNFQTSGVAEVELSVTGVPMTQPVDVVIVFDHSSSMNSQKRLENAIADTIDFALQLIHANKYNRIALVTFDRLIDYYTHMTDATADSVKFPGSTENRIVTGDGTPEGAFLSYSDANLITSQFKALQYNNIEGTNYDYGLEQCYAIIQAARNQWAEQQAELAAGATEAQLLTDQRKSLANKNQYVIFMSDGEPYQYNRMAMDYTNPSTTAWLLGDETETEIAQILADPTTYPAAQYYHPDGKHWLAEAIKAPLGSSVELPSVSYYDPYRTGLGAQIFTIGYAAGSPGSTTATVLTNIASTPERFYYAETNLQPAYDDILKSVVYAANEAWVEDQMGDSFNLQFDDSYQNGNNMSTITLNPAPFIELGSWTLNSDGTRDEYTVIEKITFTTTASGALSGAYSTLINNGGTNIYNAATETITGKSITYDLITEKFNWTIGNITRDEVTLKYYAYLEGSIEGERAEGIYDTNEFATLHYINYLGDVCEKPFPVPKLGWQEAAINYEFYLVNENGQPVNRDGVVVPFAERVLVSRTVTHEVKLNSANELDAYTLAAIDFVESGYTLYNPDAKYQVNISSGDNASRATIIDTGKPVVTTYFYQNNNKFNQNGIVPDVVDYTNTSVAFAVLLIPGVLPDQVVIDYGIPVYISVLENDMDESLDGTINAISMSIQPSTVLNYQGYEQSRFTQAVTRNTKLITENGTAQITTRNKNDAILYTPTNMTMSDEEVIYYEYLTKDGRYFYTTVTIIPATNIYYEDSFISFTDSGSYVWQTAGQTYTDKYQAEDRPGVEALLAYDANNVYGYDNAYSDNISTYSLGSARYVTVDADSIGHEPTAEFTFCGTGFDLFSVTNADTGAVLVAVYDYQTNIRVKNYVVQTYYGYSYDNEQSKFVPNTLSEDGLYQVPIIRSRDLPYGKYKVVITPKYGWAFDMNYDKTGESYNSYKIYIDSVRIYDPAGVAPSPDSVVGSAYIKDGEYIPQYMEIRDNVITAATFYTSVDDLDPNKYTKGAVFIDGISAVDDFGVSDKYKESGPNNELYLAKGQAVAFNIESDRAIKPENLLLGMKIVAGDPSNANLQITNSATTGTLVNRLISGSHEMYRKLSSYIVWDEAYYNQTGNYRTKYPIIIINTSDCIVSLTNFRWTYSEPETIEPARGMQLSFSAAAPRMAMSAIRSIMPEHEEESGYTADLHASWESSTIAAGSEASLDITTALDVIKVSVDGIELTDCYVGEDSLKHWTYKLTLDNAGEYSYNISCKNNKNEESNAIESPILTVVDSEPEKTTPAFIKFINRLLQFFRSIINILKGVFK